MKKHNFNIDHIAHLARIELTNEEKTHFEGEIEAILSFVDQLQEVDVSNIEPVAHVSGVTDMVRDDELRNDWEEKTKDALMAEAPKTENGYISVKTVLEK